MKSNQEFISRQGAKNAKLGMIRRSTTKYTNDTKEGDNFRT
jgi:hypothetical protein